MLSIHNFILLTLFIVNAYAATSKEGLAWLASKETEMGVIKRESGLLYKIITSSEAGHTPSLTSKTKCNYEGSLIDGTIFDSSYERKKPAIFAPNQVIKGWTEAMQLMKEGDIWELYLPSELAYGDRAVGGIIPPGSVLIFKLEMIEVLGGYEDGK